MADDKCMYCGCPHSDECESCGEVVCDYPDCITQHEEEFGCNQDI